MTSPTPQQLAQSGTLEDLYKQLEPIRLGAGWAKPTPSLWAEPKKSFQPFVWSYAQAKGALDAAGRLINTELAERRNLIMQNPAGGSYATSRTIVAAYQMIMPGEKARSHRHTPNALRLIIDADPGAYTIVNGERLSMMPGDVVLTPNWCWHGHGNDSRGWIGTLYGVVRARAPQEIVCRGFGDSGRKCIRHPAPRSPVAAHGRLPYSVAKSLGYRHRAPVDRLSNKPPRLRHSSPRWLPDPVRRAKADLLLRAPPRLASRLHPRGESTGRAWAAR